MAESADAALEKFQSNRPDVIVTDIAMPDVDGYRFAQMVREDERGAGVKIVALSAFHPGSDPVAAQKGFDRYLTKPIEPADLLEAVAKVAGR